LGICKSLLALLSSRQFKFERHEFVALHGLRFYVQQAGFKCLVYVVDVLDYKEVVFYPAIYRL